MSFQQIRDRADIVRGISLESVLLASGAEGDRHDHTKWRTAQGNISVTGAKFMNWTRGVGGGGAIDLAMHLNGMGFKEAVEWLWRNFHGWQAAPPVAPPKKDLRLPRPHCGALGRVKDYLVGVRGLPPAVLNPLIASGRLYADDRANAVFVLLGEGNVPVGAELRGTSGRPWRGMAPGSRKDLGFFAAQAAEVDNVILCESAIDAISCLVIHPRSRGISTAGAQPNPTWISPIIQANWPVYCGFDADPAGESMASAMIALHPTIRRLRPSHKDWNDVLRSRA